MIFIDRNLLFVLANSRNRGRAQRTIWNASKQHVHGKISCFVLRKQIRGDLKAYLAIEMSLDNTWQITEVSNSTKRHADNSGNHAEL